MTPSELDDLIQVALPDLGRMKIEDLASDQQFYEVHERIIKPRSDGPEQPARSRVMLETGPKIKRQLLLDDMGTARNTSMYADDVYANKDVLGELELPWKFQTCNWITDVNEMAMNRPFGGSRILNLMKVKEEAAMLSAIKLFEGNWWGSPSDPSDTETPLGVFFYLTKDAVKGFNGGAPAGFSDIGGVTDTNYYNWTDTYSAFTRDELVDSLVESLERTGWMSPVDMEAYSFTRQRFCLYMSYETKRKLERIAEDQNDSLGKDLYPMQIAGGGRGNMTIRGQELRWAQHTAVEDATDNRIVGVDWNTWFLYGLRGRFNVVVGPVAVPGKHTVRAVHRDWTSNYVCVNKRRNFFIYKP